MSRDVFLSHNSRDKPIVRELARALEQDAERFFGRRSEVLQLWDCFRALNEPMPQQPSPLQH